MARIRILQLTILGLTSGLTFGPNCQITAQSNQRQPREAIRTIAVGKTTALAFQLISTRECSERRSMTNAPTPSAIGGGRPGTIWIATPGWLHLRNAKSGAAIERFVLPENVAVQAVCSDPAGSRVFLFDTAHRLLTFDPRSRPTSQPVPVPGWRPASISDGHRVNGVTFDPVRQWLFLVTSAKLKKPILRFDVARGLSLASLAAPECGCYDLGALTGVAWDAEQKLLYVTDPKTTASARLAKGQDGIWRLRLYHYCEFRGPSQAGMALVLPRAASSIGARIVEKSNASRDVRPLSMRGSPRAPGLLVFECCSDTLVSARPVGAGAPHEFATPVVASGLGLPLSVRWCTRHIASDRVEALAVVPAAPRRE